MPYIIVLVLVIAIVVLAARKQKFEQKKEESGAQKKVNTARNKDKENSIEVSDYVEVNDNSDNVNAQD